MVCEGRDVLLVAGMITYVSLLQHVGVIDTLAEMALALGAPLLIALVLCYVIGVGSAFASSTALLTAFIPMAGPLLATSSHFRDSGGDLWLYLKADSEKGVDALLAEVAQQLGPLLARKEETRAALPPDHKILDQHFVDGITSPSDPASVVENILQTGTETSPGSCWAGSVARPCSTVCGDGRPPISTAWPI